MSQAPNLLRCRGLVYLHSQHIVWFDCKPGNVLLDHTGLVAKISDVGLSKMLAASQTETVLVRAASLSLQVRSVLHLVILACIATGAAMHLVGSSVASHIVHMFRAAAASLPT